jgi:uncharacterized integral membrane protein
MAIVYLVVALLIALVMLVFALANPGAVTVELLFTKISTQLSLAILAPFAAGFLVGLLVMLPGSIKNRLAVASHKRRISALEKSATPTETPAPAEPPADKKS